MLNLFVLDAVLDEKIPVIVTAANENDFALTREWQTSWLSPAASAMPNKVALHRKDNDELLGLMSYVEDGDSLAVEIVYIESAGHSNANMLRISKQSKKYIGIAKALFAYAVDVSLSAGFDGVLVFKAKTTELMEYYIQEFGARHAGSYDPFRLIIWEDAAARLISGFEEGKSEHG